jgi:methionyl-tRNA formyltransferase
MKIIILANRDIASNYALNKLLPRLSQHNIYLFLSSTIGRADEKPAQLEALTLFEQALFKTIETQTLESDDSTPIVTSFEQINSYLSQDFEELNIINSPQGLEKIRHLAPDLIVSIRYGKILKNDVLNIPMHGVLNLHSGILPNYRGVMATFWAMLHGESKIGTTLHYIQDSTIDTGEIVSQSCIPIQNGRSYFWHVLQLYITGTELIVDAISSIMNNKQLNTAPQTPNGHYFSFPKSTDLLKFEQQGFMLFNKIDVASFINVKNLDD